MNLLTHDVNFGLKGSGNCLVKIREISDDANPNGSLDNIAGIVSREGNVLGMMPHPERSCEAILGSTDGNLIFQSMVHSLVHR